MKKKTSQEKVKKDSAEVLKENKVLKQQVTAYQELLNLKDESYFRHQTMNLLGELTLSVKELVIATREQTKVLKNLDEESEESSEEESEEANEEDEEESDDVDDEEEEDDED